jgi:hypothetical protein
VTVAVRLSTAVTVVSSVQGALRKRVLIVRFLIRSLRKVTYVPNEAGEYTVGDQYG